MKLSHAAKSVLGFLRVVFYPTPAEVWDTLAQSYREGEFYTEQEILGLLGPRPADDAPRWHRLRAILARLKK